VYLSGTVAAAREAAFYGLPAIAVSQYFLADTEVDWERSARLARRALETVLARSLPQGAFWNINLPHGDAHAREPEIVFCPCCTRALPLAYRADDEGFYYRRGLYHSRDRSPEADVDVCFRGDIAISMLQI
jgi:5'-nucleotidase